MDANVVSGCFPLNLYNLISYDIMYNGVAAVKGAPTNIATAKSQQTNRNH